MSTNKNTSGMAIFLNGTEYAGRSAATAQGMTNLEREARGMVRDLGGFAIVALINNDSPKVPLATVAFIG